MSGATSSKRGGDEPAPSLVLGTAGHIDHGKTALIRALTGVDTDRLPEEKRRGITIELGFAPLDLGDGLCLGVVDVPGHEALVRTMVAGATGIDLVLLVVAADEGVMPQTREHLAICELLGLGRAVVALSKCDAAEAEMQALAAEEIRELLAASRLEAAEAIPVSARTGEGLERLRAALRDAATTAGPRTPRSGPPRLAIDRAFAAKGFGCVVTGTLVGAPLAVGDAVELLPTGQRARVRGLQRFGKDTAQARPGARCAVNLQGVELADVGRGLLVTAPDSLAPTRSLDVELSWLASAPPLQGLSSVEFLYGTCERRARLAPIGAPSLAPGQRGLARVHLEGEAVALLPGDRFVLRGFARSTAAGATLGGGRVLDVAPPHRRRSDPALAAELEILARGDPAEGLRARVTRAGYAGRSETQLAHETGFAASRMQELLAEEREAGRLQRTPARCWLGAEAVAALEQRLLGALEAFHHEAPLRPGMPRGALRGTLPENCAAGTFELLMEGLCADSRVFAEADHVQRSDHVARLSPAQEAMAAYIRADAMQTGLEPSTPKQWAAELGTEGEPLRELLAHLERDGSLVRAPGDLWFDRCAVDELRERVVAHLAEHGALDTPAYKALLAVSRKYAVPLMELFDAEHLTIRRGDRRVLRRGAS